MDSPRGGEGWPLAWRLLVPLAALAVVFWGGVTLFLIRDLSSRMDREGHRRLESLADSLAISGMALDQDLLSRVRGVAGVEAAVISPEGAVLASTLPAAVTDGLKAAPHGEVRPGHIEVAGERYRVVERRVPAGGRRRGTKLIVAASTRGTDELKAGITWTIVAATGTQLLLFLVMGHFLVKSATRPLARLAVAARKLGEGSLHRSVPGGGGREIDAVASEFNHMVGELARSREELVRAGQLAAAGRTAASVAHEIRNPLSSIRMNLQLVSRALPLASDLHVTVGDVLDEVDRLELVVGNLLDVTVPARYEPAPAQLNAVVEDVLRLTSQKLDHLGVEVRADLQSDLPLIPLDARKAKQALLNVILNAADAMPGGGTLRAATRRRGDWVDLHFEDTGSGVEEGVARRAFEPFFSTKRDGAGLGLHVVRNIIEMHGGRVRLEAVSPRGTRCVMEFPLAAPRRAQERRTA